MVSHVLHLNGIVSIIFNCLVMVISYLGRSRRPSKVFAEEQIYTDP